METYREYMPVVIIAAVALIFLWTFWQRKRRRMALEALAASMGLPFNEYGPAQRALEETGFELFGLGNSQNAGNMIEVPFSGGRIQIFDYRYTTGGGRSRTTHNFTVALIPCACGIPSFDLKPETFMHKIGELIGFKDLDFPDFPLFSDKYRLLALDDGSARAFFNPSRLAWFERNPGLYVQGMPGNALLLRTGTCLPAEEWPAFIERAKIFAAEVLR